MKIFLKYFSLAFICFFIVFLLGSHIFLRINQENENFIDKNIHKMSEKNIKTHEKEIVEKKGIEKSDRINFILLGMDDVRTDTIVFASFDRKAKKVDLISIPRDTYLYRKGYEKAEQRKINAVHGDHGVEGVKASLQYILDGIPIHHYIIIDYEGVKNIVDSIGGVEIEVPFHMKYKDNTANPPLNIDIPKGRQVLDGKDSVRFLRYRKGNNSDGGYKDGDLGRIKAQQEFLFSFLKKSSGPKLPLVVRDGLKYVKTDISLNEALGYGKDILKIEEEDFYFITLPGVASYRSIEGKTLSYYIQDEVETKKLIEKIYNIPKKVPIE